MTNIFLAASFLQDFTFGEKLYIIVILCFVPILLFGVFTNIKIQSTFNKYSRINAKTGLTAAQVARRMLDENGCANVQIVKIQGNLTDNFNPKNNTISLSTSVYDSTSVASIGVACHEAGHAIQHARNYIFIKIRSAMVPVLRLTQSLIFPLLLVGMLLQFFATLSSNISMFFIILALVFFGGSMVFSLVTLPTEFNASSRAKKYLATSGVFSHEELKQSSKVLNAAALTYVASFLVSLLYFLRFLALILMYSGKRK